MSAPPTSARVLVVGDSGVGKSSLIHLICHNEVLAASQPTIGCKISVKVRPRTQQGKVQLIEFFEVGGNTKYRREARFPFYSNFNAIIYVYDLADESTLTSLWEWNKEIHDYMDAKTAVSKGSTTVTIPSSSTTPVSRIAENPYASISQRRSGSRTEPSKGYRHRATTQCFDNPPDSRRSSAEGSSLPGVMRPTSSPTSDSSMDYGLNGEDDPLHPAQSVTLPPILIVGTKADLCAKTLPGSSNPSGSWQHDLTQLGSLILRTAAQIMQRVLFLPVPMKNFLHLGGPPFNGDKAGGLVTNKASEVLNHFRQEWNATVLEMTCHALQEEKLHRIELFTDKVMDSVFSFSCKV